MKINKQSDSWKHNHIGAIMVKGRDSENKKF